MADMEPLLMPPPPGFSGERGRLAEVLGAAVGRCEALLLLPAVLRRPPNAPLPPYDAVGGVEDSLPPPLK